MPRLAIPLVYDLLEVADGLLAIGGRTGLRKAAMRRSVSTGYYAVFHALCFVCANELAGRHRGELVEAVYRSLDHGIMRKRLSGREAAAITPQLLKIGVNLADLQDARHSADYRMPTLSIRRDQTRDLVALAHQTVALIETLEPEDRIKLAVLLIAKPRQA